MFFHRGEITAAAVAERFADCADFELRRISPGGMAMPGVSLCFLDGLVSGAEVSQNVLRPLTESARLHGMKTGNALAEAMLHGAVCNYSARRRETLDEVVGDIAAGSCAILLDSAGCAVTFDAKSAARRAVSEPKTEKSVKGAKDAFTETLRVNSALIRRRIHDSDLKLRELSVGRRSHTKIAVLYMSSIASPAIWQELLRRLEAIDIDGVTGIEDIEEPIADTPGSPFPELLSTERSDKFARALLAGRVGFLVDGLPMGFLVPGTLPEFLQAPDDAEQHWLVASAIRFLRWMAFAASLLLPALLVAAAMYHQEMIPAKLLLSMVNAEQKVPFTVAGEVIGMLIAFELLQEAGLRLPDPVGDTVSIIGALIVGQSAVEAKVISPIAVIVVALTGICGYVLPNRDLGAGIRLWRFLLVLAAVGAGLFGVLALAALLIWRLCGMESFGVPYTAPLTGGGWRGKLQSLVRPPEKDRKLRDPQLGVQDLRRSR